MPIGAVWQSALETPLINIMVTLSAVAFGSYGLAILTFTVIIRGLLFPLTLRMLHSMRGLQELQPRMQEIQKKYSDPKRRNQEVMRLYKEAGVNPLGCLGPQLIQLPIFIALYQVIRITLGDSPEAVLNLSRRLYDVPFIQNAVPLSREFLWLDLGSGGSIVLVTGTFAAMWLQQRISTNRATQTNPSQAQMNSMMQWMLPAMFAWFVFITPSGVGLYWFASTAIGLVLHWIFVGPGDFTFRSLVPAPLRESLGIDPPAPATRRGARGGEQQPRTQTQTDASNGSGTESRDTDASNGDERPNSRRSGRQSSGGTRPAPRSGRRRRRHRG
ncbi:MAG: YidC/Oxa1 family membrane protein insertase [Chloroflexi bacterium]|nr:YidC/Oxa1 family membrane protein insertase [Chloroflexota bacterium]MQC16924.1 protein translocase component YidC [Chloroflexota bacterium]